MWGRGAKDSSQTHLGFLPVPHTDFIFSSFAEEHGFVGIVVALVLYFLLIMQVVQNAQTATDRAGLYICMGVAALLLFHVLVNVGMVVGRMPVTGYSATADEFGRIQYVVCFFDAGAGEQRQTETVCELKIDDWSAASWQKLSFDREPGRTE